MLQVRCLQMVLQLDATTCNKMKRNATTDEIDQSKKGNACVLRWRRALGQGARRHLPVASASRVRSGTRLSLIRKLMFSQRHESARLDTQCLRQPE